MEILKSRYTGWFKAVCTAINPNKEELEELLGEEVESEPVYQSEWKGIRSMKIDFYLQPSTDDILFKYTIYLKEEDERFQSGAKLWINQIGEFQITDKEENLFDSFKYFQHILSWKTPDGKVHEYYKQGAKPNEIENLGNIEYRIAKKGEYELMHLTMLAKEKPDKKGYHFLHMNSIFNGELPPIRIGEPLFCAFAYCENNEEYKQKVFSKFMPLADYQDLISDKSGKYNSKAIKKWKDSFEYNSDKNIFNYGRLQVLKPSMLPKVKDLSEDSSDY